METKNGSQSELTEQSQLSAGKSGQEQRTNTLAGRGVSQAVRGEGGQESERTLFGTVLPERPKGKVTEGKLIKLLEWQKKRCAITALELTPENATVDHIHPVKSGGPTEMENVQIVCKEANRIKGSLSMDELIYWCRVILSRAEAIGASKQA